MTACFAITSKKCSAYYDHLLGNHQLLCLLSFWFVEYDGEGRRDREDRRGRDREPPRKGNTIHVFGIGVTEEILTKAFSNFGNIININIERERK